MSSVQLQIKILNPNAYTLNTIIGSPRTCTPYDVKAAGANLEITPEEGADRDEPGVLSESLALVRYLLIDYFSLAHSSGLYNRQMNLWQSLAKVTSVKVNQLTQGLFTKTELPIIDLYFLDAKSRVLLLGSFLKPHEDWKDEKKCRSALSDFMRRAEKVQRKDPPAFAGLFLCFPEPFPPAILKQIQAMTGASDPIGRYESIVPAIGVPINLIESAFVFSNETENGKESGKTAFELIHPDIVTEKRGRKERPE